MPIAATSSSPKTRTEWAGRIDTTWRKSRERKNQAAVKHILETGELLIAAKKVLPRQFTAMIKNDLLFKARNAQLYMTIARDDRIADPKCISLLPHALGTLYELTKLPDNEFETAFQANLINSQMTRAQAQALHGKKKGTNRTKEPLRTVHNRFLSLRKAYRQVDPSARESVQDPFRELLDSDAEFLKPGSF